MRKPRKLVLSPTRIAIYLTCRLKYKFTYVDKIARFYYKPKSAHSFGASLHRALQSFHELGGADTQTTEELATHLRETWVAVGYASEAEADASLTEGLKILEEYHAAPPPSGTVTLMTERQLRYDMGDFILSGRIDRIDQTLDGGMEIVDYKSGRLSVSAREVRDDLAMSIYQLLGKLEYPQERVSGSILCLRSGVKATVELTQEELAAVEAEVRAIAQEILALTEDTEIEPIEIDSCTVCDFQKLCSRIRDRSRMSNF